MTSEAGVMEAEKLHGNIACKKSQAESGRHTVRTYGIPNADALNSIVRMNLTASRSAFKSRTALASFPLAALGTARTDGLTL
jgi:hypothetical protein